MKTRYKFFRLQGKTIKSNSGDLKWKKGEWQKVDGKLDICNNGLHCSKTVYDAFSFVQGELVGKVEVRGGSIVEDNKECWSEMRIVELKKWTKKDSLRLAIFSAELVLKNFEDEYPDDKRPREAIEAAKKVLFKDTAKNRSAAQSAWSAQSAAESAWSAESVWSAAWSAWSAAQSAAESAAESVAWSAESVAWSAAWSVARSVESAALEKIQKFMEEQYKTLEEYK